MPYEELPVNEKFMKILTQLRGMPEMEEPSPLQNMQSVNAGNSETGMQGQVPQVSITQTGSGKVYCFKHQDK